jgi:phosphatidylinositol alpha-1,6-mannosyltransferase
VTFLGALPDQEVTDLFGAADVFVHPNRVEATDFEGFGIVFLEAAAAGLPAIGGRSGGVPEAIVDGATGLLVGGEDPQELRQCLERLVDSAELRKRLGSAARERVLRDFSLARATREVARLDAGLRMH